MKNNNDSGFKKNIWKMYLFTFFVSLHFIGGVLVPFFTDWGKISFAQVMLLQSWFMLWVFLLEIPTGTIADYLGRKHCLALGCLVNIVGVVVYTSSPSFLLFLIGEFLWALSGALFSGADSAFVYDSLKRNNRQKFSKNIFGKIEISRLTGFMVGAPIGSIVAASFGLNMPMLLMSIPLTIAFAIALTLKEPQIKQAKTKYFAVLKEGVRFFYNHKILKILAIDLIAIGAIGYFVIWLYQPMLKQAGLNIAFFGIVHAVFVASEIMFIKSNHAMEKILGSKKRIITISFVVAGAMLILGGLTASLPLILLVIFVSGGISLSKAPVFENYLNKYIPSEKRATVLSTVFMFKKLALVIISPLVGILADWSLNSTLIIIGIIAIAFPILSKIEEKHLMD